jgi:regulator of chromosome condensation
VVAVKAGGMHTVALTESGRVYTWGCNDEGALGREATCMEDECIPGETMCFINVTLLHTMSSTTGVLFPFHLLTYYLEIYV